MKIKRLIVRSALGASLAVSSLSCGGTAQPAETPAPETTAPPSEAPAGSAETPAAEAPPPEEAPPGKWADMNHMQRLGYMKKVVFPKMKAEFAAFDAKEFGEMNCGTCHGKNAKEKNFEMPNPDLPKLSPEGDFKKHRAKTPKILDFMLKKVEPGMAELLSEPMYDPKTQKGFGCFNCHTQAGK